jgi:hypothetical protein
MRWLPGLIAVAACARPVATPPPSLANVNTDDSRTAWYCAPRVYTDGPCIPLTYGDARAIQRAIFAYIDADALERWPDWAGARELARGSIKRDGVGAYFLYVDSVDKLQLSAVAKTEGKVEHGFTLTLERDDTGWVITHVKPYTNDPDAIDTDVGF